MAMAFTRNRLCISIPGSVGKEYISRQLSWTAQKDGDDGAPFHIKDTETRQQSSSTLCELSEVKKLSNAVRHARPRELFSSLSKLKITITPYHVSEALKCIKNVDLAVGFFHWASSNSNYVHDNAAYSALIKVLAQSHKFGKAWDVIESMKTSGLMPQVSDFNQLITSYFIAGKHSRVLHTLLAMPNYGVFPSSHTYNMVIRCFLKCDKHEVATIVCKKMIQRFHKDGNMQNAMLVFDSMKEWDLSIDLPTWNLLINGFRKSGSVDQSIELLSEMQEMGVVPDAVTLRNLVKGLRELSRIDDACDLMKKMKGRGLKPDPITYTVLVEGFCNLGRINEGHELLNEVLREQHRVDAVVYDILVSSYSKCDKIDEASVLCNKMLRNDIQPMVATHRLLVIGLCKAGRFEEARYFNDMVDAKRKTSIRSTTSILVGTDRIKNEAELLMSTMVSIGYFADFEHKNIDVKYEKALDSSYKSLIRILCDAKRVDYASHILTRKLELGFPSDKLFYKIMIEGACKLGDAETIMKLIATMQSNGFEPDLPMYSHLVIELFNAKQAEAAVYVFHGMREKGVLPDCAILNSIVSGLCKVNKVSEACDVFFEVVNSGFEPNITNVKALIFKFEGEEQEIFDVKVYVSLLNRLVKSCKLAIAASVWDVILEKQVFMWT